jgi:hypothetical protein
MVATLGATQKYHAHFPLQINAKPVLFGAAPGTTFSQRKQWFISSVEPQKAEHNLAQYLRPCFVHSPFRHAR